MRDTKGRFIKGTKKSDNWRKTMKSRTGSAHSMWKGGQKIEMVKCECGCGTIMNRYDKRNRISKRILGHGMTGKKQSEKQRLSVSEKNNVRWNGGTSRAFKTGYYSHEYRQWRKSVFERDGYTCQDCGKCGGYLTAHHIKGQAKYPHLRFDLSNGLTLCEPCHSNTDNYKGRGKMKILTIN